MNALAPLCPVHSHTWLMLNALLSASNPLLHVSAWSQAIDRVEYYKEDTHQAQGVAALGNIVLLHSELHHFTLKLVSD